MVNTTLPRTGPIAAHRAAPGASRCERAWAVLATVPDPEVPALSIVDLGIVRDVVENADGVLELMLTPTYSGCPATEAIEADALAAIAEARLGPARVVMRRAPAWTTRWISDEGRSKLRAYGIAPPAHFAAGDARPLDFVRQPVMAAAPTSPACPRCGSARTERLSAFGATACKSLHRCLDCREPFEYFKPI